MRYYLNMVSVLGTSYSHKVMAHTNFTFTRSANWSILIIAITAGCRKLFCTLAMCTKKFPCIAGENLRTQRISVI